MQRIFDIFFSLFLIVILSPLLLPIMILLRSSGEGNIFYLQPRIGKDGIEFSLIKFATMLKDSPNIGTRTITTKNDPRVLPVGIFLRKTKLNELPQLINIFIGDMSFVGPRPLTEEVFKFYSVDLQNRISQIRPGLSGIGSLVFRYEDRLLSDHADPIQFYQEFISPYKAALEIWYIENSSFKLYISIVLLTVAAVVLPRPLNYWKMFTTLPPPPRQLANSLSFM